MNIFSLEQISAIESKGGVLVSAGAGSGKTAVLVEHLIYWIKDLSSFKQNQEMELSQELKRLVVITFTVKAAEEMKMRLFERIDSIGDSKTWEIVKKYIHHVFIGTIDGFSSKIVKSNLTLLPISVPFEIVSSQEWDDKIQNLYWSWHQSLSNDGQKKIALLWSKKLIAWISSVMSNTTSRINWNNFCEETYYSEDFIDENNKQLVQMLKEYKWIELKDCLLELSMGIDHEKYGDKKWFQFIETIKGKNSNIDLLMDFQHISKINDEFKGLRVPTQDELLPIAEAIRQIRDFIKDINPIFKDWKKCLEVGGPTIWKEVIHLSINLKKYIELNYGRIAGFCFSDLSYYMQLVLKNEQSKTNIPYYVVVDELQDTSQLQLDQIYLLAAGDSKNLYGVGDIKQAIYAFRGGESNVFFEFEKLVNNNRINLFDNYRSHEKIVQFNNKLFETLFEKTQSFQQIPKTINDTDSDSIVEIIQWDVSKEDKIPEWQQEILEFYALVNKVKQIIQSESNSSVAILFRTNGQIKKFSSLMYQEKLSFVVQWKISYVEDPLYQIFVMLMLIGQANKNNQETEKLEKTLKFYISLVSSKEEIYLNDFYNNWLLFDAFTCFYTFLDKMKISCAYQAPFLELLKSKSKYASNNYKQFLLWLEEIKEDTFLASWTLPFNSPSKMNITLQTIHASKGLQYDHVLLARLSSQSSGNTGSDGALSEAHPHAFKEFTFLKKPWKSPCYHFHTMKKDELAKEESLRLFYVACTRARKTLTICLSEKIKKNSWGSLVLSAGLGMAKVVVKELDDNMRKIIQNEIRLLSVFESLIYKQWRSQFVKNEKVSGSLKLIPSLSVTAMTVFERCPMKFYFENILNLEPQELFKINKTYLSNAKRGTHIHTIIQKYLNSEISYDNALAEIDGDAGLYFKANAKDWLCKIKHAEIMQIEQEMRFSWKDNIILGTPDLYTIDGQSIEVWDFKTGDIDTEDLSVYRLQLSWYAYAIHQKTRLNNSTIKMKIIALDNKKEYQYEMKSSELISNLEYWWSNFNNYHIKKLNHCEKCSYQVYCSKNS